MFQIALMAIAARKFGSSRVMGTLRAVAYGSVVVVAVGAIGMRKARAAVVDDGLRFGDELARVAPYLGESNTLTVNGQRVHFGTQKSLDGMTTVLDKFQDTCEAAEGGNAPVWDSVPDDPSQAKGLKKADKMPIYRKQDGQRGFIVCLVPTDNQSPDGFRASVRDFVEHHGALQLGKLRYANVHDTPTGTTVVTVWTDESFNIGAFFPDQDGHDTQGVDPTIMKRPDGSVRVLSGVADHQPYKAFLYESKATPKEAMDAYDKKMFADGWVSVTAPQMAGGTFAGVEAHAFMRDGFVGYTTASTGPTGTTLIGVGETAAKADEKKNLTVKDSDGF